MLNQMIPKAHRKMPTLHDYQQEANDLIRKAWKEGTMKVLLVQPTGSGKTITAGQLIWEEVEKGGRVLVVADRKKLVRQFAASVEDKFGVQSTIEMGGVNGDDSRVVCATPKTMTNRIKSGKFHAEEFSLLIFEEAHLALGAGFQEIAKHFDKSRIIGLTATPRASKQRDLLKFFDIKVETRTIKELIEQGYLAPLTIRNIPITISVENSTKSGDFTEEDCGHALEPHLQSLAEAVAEHGRGRCSLVYLPLIEISKKFTEILCSLGVRAKHVDGEMTEREQAKVQRELEMGEIECVCCSLLWTVGIDVRPVNLICNLRLTTSWVLFVQICGRGTRCYDPVQHGLRGTSWGEKRDCILLDPLWNCENHSLLQRPACLLASSEDEVEQIDEEIKKQIASGGEANVLKATESVRDQRMEALKDRLERLSKRKSTEISAMEFFVSQGNYEAANFEPVERWHNDAITPGQRMVLTRNKFDIPADMKKGQASLLIDSILKRSKAGMASAEKAIQAKALGMADAFQRDKDSVKRYLDMNKKGFDLYKDLCD